MDCRCVGADRAGDDKGLHAVERRQKTLNNMTDGRYTSYWSSSTNRNAYLDIEAPQGKKMGSVYIQFFENAAPFDVQTPDEAGNWQTISTYETGFWRSMCRWRRAMKRFAFARRMRGGVCSSSSCMSLPKGMCRFGCRSGSRRLQRRICWRLPRIRTMKFCFWAARSRIMRAKRR